MEPNFPEALNNASGVCMRLGRPGEAVALARAALSLRPDYSDAHYNLNTALRCAGRHDDAVQRSWALLLEHCESSPVVDLPVDPSTAPATVAPPCTDGKTGPSAEAGASQGPAAPAPSVCSAGASVPPVARPTSAPPGPALHVSAGCSTLPAESCAASRPVFVCVKWGRKYGIEYVNRLFHAVRAVPREHEREQYWSLVGLCVAVHLY